ncbi:Cyclin-U4-1 [Diplonema papillatum]|nr:Cyclin-U4-1 [Diplonema papillatum]KAJ9445940.1 Cyclin-U4-1 [Diplonema papillatum]
MGKGSASRSETSTSLLCAGFVHEVEEMARKGDATRSETDALTVFDSAPDMVPAISLQGYLERWVTYSCCSTATIAIASRYIDRCDVPVTTRNKHRLLLAALLAAAKFHDDVFYSNTFYATVGGSTLAEINRLETAFLSACDWTMMVDREEYDDVLLRLTTESAFKNIAVLPRKRTVMISDDVDAPPPSCVARLFSFFGVSKLMSSIESSA